MISKFLKKKCMIRIERKTTCLSCFDTYTKSEYKSFVALTVPMYKKGSVKKKDSITIHQLFEQVNHVVENVSDIECIKCESIRRNIDIEQVDVKRCTTKTNKTMLYTYRNCGDYLCVELIRNKQSEYNKDGELIVTKGNTFINDLLDEISFNQHEYRLVMIVHHLGASSNEGHYYVHRYINH